MKKITNFLKNMFFLMAILLINQAFAQSGVLSGKVTDSKGEVVTGANVVAGSNSTMTDSNGIYTFSSVSNGSITITTSYIGFQTNVKEAIVEGNTTIDFVLQEETSDLNEVVVTGVVNPKTKLKSSVSITTVNAKQIEQSAPRSTAEIFRTIPGIRSESSGGEGNSNISVRGVPISSGGSKYLQIQEDGLPVLLYGDISFGTADIFTRFDRNVAKIEAIRGGSASTLSSNSPGGIINFISKTGKTGGGVRSQGFTANNGGQFKFNITKEFENGSVTIYTKFLNDRAAAYMPMPIKVTGTNSDPNWDSVSGYDATTGALQSVYLSQNVGLGSDGELRRGKVADGMHPVSKTIGASINFDLLNGWKLSNNGRFSFNNGQFIAPFPAEVASAASIANSFGAGSTLSYANDGSAFNTANGLVARIHMFDVQLNNFNNFMNDFRITKKYDKVGITAGYFKSIQNISMSWLWNSYLQEVSDNNPRLINVTDASGNLLSQNGLYAYGVPYWGNCCTRNYDTQYNVSAPYANVTLDATEKLSLEGGIRYDKGQVDGSFSGAVQTVYDINNDGDISTPESSVSAVDTANANAVDYSYGYVSYTLGANYLLNEQQSFFVRYSKGASAKADRILFSGLNYLDGDKINSLDYLAQAEFGYKRKFSKGYLYATLFSSATTEEGGFEASSNSIIDNDYKSYGLELESSYDVNEDLNFRGGFTYTKAEITSGANDGNQPRRQPKLMYNFIPTYKFSQSKNTLGLSFIGQTKAYAQDNNDLVMNGFVIVNGFVEFGLTKGLSLNVAGNNLLDTLAITESEEGSITENTTNIVRARPLPGRSISMTLSYKF